MTDDEAAIPRWNAAHHRTDLIRLLDEAREKIHFYEVQYQDEAGINQLAEQVREQAELIARLTAPPAASATEIAVNFLGPFYQDDNLSKLAFATKDEQCLKLAHVIEAAERRGRAEMREAAAHIVLTDHESIPCPAHYSAEVARTRARRIAETIQALPDTLEERPSIGVDPECVDLAHHFLIAEPCGPAISDAQAARNLTSLSEAIQRAVEDWFEAQNWEPS